jgi:hypothetical protein
MSKQREALEIALEAMEDHAKQYPHMQKGYTLDAIEALREALAEPEQKPTGIIRTIGGYPDESQHTVEWLVKHKDLHDGDKLYASPPARKPAGTVTGWYGGHPVIEPIDGWIPAVGTVLYSAPPARKPLTDEEIDNLELPPNGCTMRELVRAIERATESANLKYSECFGKAFYILGTSSTVSTHIFKMLEIEQLGWTAVEALETHLRFSGFAEDWNAPGMEVYDEM